MNTIQRCNVLLLQVAGDTFVGRQHELLNQTVRDVSLRARHALHQSVFVELDYRLGQVEVDRPAPHAFAIQDQRQVAHQLEPVNILVIMLPQPRIAFENEFDVCVGHAFRRANHAFIERVTHDFAVRVDLHYARQYKPVHVGPQTAQVGRELHRQHGNRAVGEVNGRAAQTRLEIDSRSLTHIMRNVGDVHLQLEVACRQPAHRHSIIEIACRLPIDSNNGQCTVIMPMRQLLRRQRSLESFCLLQYLYRKLVRQVVLANNDLNIHAKIVRIAEYLHYSPGRSLCRRRPTRDLDIHHEPLEIVIFAAMHFLTQDAVRSGVHECTILALLLGKGETRPLHPLRNHNFLRHLIVNRRHVILPRAVMEGADHGRMRARQ